MLYFKWIASLLGVIILWVAVSLYGALSGWWLSSIAPKNDTQEFISEVKDLIQLEKQGNIALVLIENGDVVYENYSASVDVINRNTLFPLASMSKFFTAYGVMQLVESGKIQLDASIGKYLTRWRLPDSSFDNSKVTIRQLLSHTSGLTDRLGFGDFEPDEVIPTLEESLNKPRASTGTKVIELGREPGTEWEYSGGGYLITQLLVEETSKMNFESWMHQAVFAPLEMNRSTYEYLGGLDNISNSYNTDGQPSTIYRYESSAATGLSSTPADLVKFVQALLQPNNNIDGVLSRDGIESMRIPLGHKMGAAIWGLGAMLYAPTSGGEHVFGHDGANDPAINTSLRINPISGDAIIVLATGSKSIASEAAYEWTLWQTGYPDFLSIEKAIESAFVPSIWGVVFILFGYLLLWLKQRNNKKEI